MEPHEANKIFTEWKDLGQVTVYSVPTPWGQVYRRSGELFVHKNEQETLLLVYLGNLPSYSGRGFYILESGTFLVGNSKYSYRLRNTNWYLDISL